MPLVMRSPTDTFTDPAAITKSQLSARDDVGILSGVSVSWITSIRTCSPLGNWQGDRGEQFDFPIWSAAFLSFLRGPKEPISSLDICRDICHRSAFFNSVQTFRESMDCWGHAWPGRYVSGGVGKGLRCISNLRLRLKSIRYGI